MNAIYGITVFVGALGMLLAVGLSMNPERPPLPRRIRVGVLAVFGFGIAGISASFAGWSAGLAAVAALAGAAALGYLGIRYAPVGDFGDSADDE